MGLVVVHAAIGPGLKAVPPAGYDPAFPTGKVGVLVQLDDRGTRKCLPRAVADPSQGCRRRPFWLSPLTRVSRRVGAKFLLIVASLSCQ